VPIGELQRAIFEGEAAVAALNERYGGLVKPSITFFGEPLPRRFGQCAAEDFPSCELLIILGTSLKVQPFASLVSLVKPNVPRLLINRNRVGEDLGLDFGEGTTDVFYGGECDDGARRLCRLANMGEL
jgi:NAD-dependent SIR2 family protein deacetylase